MSLKFDCRGLVAPVFSPMFNDGSLNIEILPRYADHVKDTGVTAVYVNGTSGEGLSLTISERKYLAEAWIKVCKPRGLKVIIQVGAGGLKDTQDLAIHAEHAGAYAIATLPCLYDRPSNVEDLVDYCREVGKVAPNTPLLYYHIPFKTQVKLSMEDFFNIGPKEIPTLVGMKYTDEDVSGEGAKCLKAGDGNMAIFSGFDQKFAECMALGYCGGISVSFNFLGKDAFKIFTALSGSNPSSAEKETAAKSQTCITSTLDLLFKHAGGQFGVSILKSAMKVLSGIDVGPVRKPLKTYSKEVEEALAKELSKAGHTVHY